MLFCSAVFLFWFLILLLAAYFLLPRRARNLLLLGASLFFYAWGAHKHVLVLLASIALNYLFGIGIDRLQGARARRWALALAVFVNLALLGVFKYAGFVATNLNSLLGLCGLPSVAVPDLQLPLGISFFTFHALSYVIDVYRREVKALKNVIDFGLYISFFPQSIAGPIVRYHDVAAQLTGRRVTEEGFASGSRQFLAGLAKKMLVANTLAGPADAIFGLPAGALTCSLAWLGAACYTLQIYFDFSGYSDMAIGLARLFGFEFRANFDYPYVSRSVTEFWRRWHISLSTWFRDYLYIPLGGNRKGAWRTYANLVTVFFLCGLWHGASWAFAAWGLYHGAFLVIERAGWGQRLERFPAPLRHAYALLVATVGWVFFKAKTFGVAASMLQAMAGLGSATAVEYLPAAYLQADVVLALVLGGIFAMPVVPALGRLWQAARAGSAARAEAADAVAGVVTAVALAAVTLASLMTLAGGTYNPFIYFNF
jgi:alginate O-acetyltransferase complex protein AlgI